MVKKGRPTLSPEDKFLRDLVYIRQFLQRGQRHSLLKSFDMLMQDNIKLHTRINELEEKRNEQTEAGNSEEGSGSIDSGKRDEQLGLPLDYHSGHGDPKDSPSAVHE